jgi:hypothetical protein
MGGHYPYFLYIRKKCTDTMPKAPEDKKIDYRSLLIYALILSAILGLALSKTNSNSLKKKPST